NGATSSVVVVTPTVSTVYSVTGSNTLASCVSTKTIGVKVNPVPVVSIYSPFNPVCEGTSLNLLALGANSYYWSVGLQGSTIAVTPNSNSTYSVMGFNTYGCTGYASLQVTVNPLPVLNVTGTSTLIFEGESVTLTASGANTYTWSSPDTTIIAPVITLTLNTGTSFAVAATGTNGCESNSVITVGVFNCSGIDELNTNSENRVHLFPNPFINEITIKSIDELRQIQVFDRNGKIIFNTACREKVVTLNTIELAPGFYYLRAISISGVEVSKIRTFTSTAPYYEGFNSITSNNQFPNCSWLPVGNWFTSASGNKCAGFTYTPAATNYCYSNGILLNAGITYSASVWYSTASMTYTNWTNFALLLGSSQSTSGLVTLASTSGPAMSLVLTSMSNTFVVSTTGIYYLVVRGTSDGSCCSNVLKWDDLNIRIPCNINPVNISAVANSYVLCQGQQATLTASGAQTYLWNNGATTPTLGVTPSSNINYVVTGSNTLTGCSATTNVNLIVNPSPILSSFLPNNSICIGNSITLNANGASNYTWNTGSNNSSIVVNPTVTTSYTVTGSNNFGCKTSAVIQIVVNALPQLTITSTANTICAGEQVVLNAQGALSYSWSSFFGSTTGTTVAVNPSGNITYTLIGVDQNGCSNKASYALTVNACTGMVENLANAKNTLHLYPNPAGNEVVVDGGDNRVYSVGIYDLNGKEYSYSKTDVHMVTVDLRLLIPGFYLVKVNSQSGMSVMKLIKE
ncbi:MAG: T9SS type A sorting domain-containing protein, partial [Flavobacteriia bacterium]|nr:T9SS type A sorting domain-containing protein [Flavobacteriia bacterium]